MSTIFDYLDHVSYDSIYDRPFKELDVLALTELSMNMTLMFRNSLRP